MNVYEITKKYLIDNGYDGLFTDDCGCLLDDLMPCDCDCSYCEAGYKLSVEEADRLGYEVDPDWDYIVCEKKPGVVDKTMQSIFDTWNRRA